MLQICLWPRFRSRDVLIQSAAMMPGMMQGSREIHRWIELLMGGMGQDMTGVPAEAPKSVLVLDCRL
jgi:hypothetical protein